MGGPEEIATAALFLASSDSSFVNGVELFVDGVLHRFKLVLEAHDVVAAVHVQGFAGYGAGEVAGEEEGYAADFELVDVAVKRGALGGAS